MADTTDTAVKADPADRDVEVRILLKRVHTLLSKLQYEEALSLAREAVALAPRNWKAWRALGSACSHQDEAQELEDAFEQAVRLAPTPWDEMETWCTRGIAENDANAWEAALLSFAKVAKLEPDWFFPWLMRGMVLGNMGTFVDPHHHEEALVALDRALTLSGMRVTDKRVIYSLKAKSLYSLGRREEAEQCGWKAAAFAQLEQARKESPRQLH